MTQADLQIFDTHAHIISDDPIAYPPSEYGQKATVEPFTAEQLREGLSDANVSKACIVQRFHYYREDNAYVLDSCLANPDHFTPVIMLDGQDPGSPDQLTRLTKEQPIGGIRLASPSMAKRDTRWLNSPEVMALWERSASLELPVTLIMFEPHSSYVLPALKIIANTFPDLPVIIDHLGTQIGATHEGWKQREDPSRGPYITAPDFGITSALRQLISCSNVSYKFSGINLSCMNADGVDPAAFLRKFVDEFGAERVVFGSDIGQTKGPYSHIVADLHQATSMLTAIERSQVLYENANRIYSHLRN